VLECGCACHDGSHCRRDIRRSPRREGSCHARA
jgi:hypothetical protein